MNTHIEQSDILNYVSDLLPAEKKEAIESHISSCQGCLLRLSDGFAKKKKACDKAVALFKGYLEGELLPDEMTDVKNHLLICDACDQKYHKLVEEKEAKALEAELNLKTFDISVYNLPLNKLGEIQDAGSEEKKLEIIGKDMDISLIHDLEGNLKVYLKSDKYDVAGASVSIGRSIEDGFQPLITATAAEEGVANLGRMNTIKEHRAQGPLAISIDKIKKIQDK